jgi:hypothetical protein
VKPLPSEPLTAEDEFVRSFVFGFARSDYDWGLLLARSVESDRRDAELMFGYERAKANLISRDGLQRYIGTRATVNAIMSERVEPAE